jgi:hypothetical protein
MPASNSLFYALTIDDWERITFYTVASKSTFLGPPSGLCSLSLVCRHVHDAISIDNNSRLFARIFRFKFDCTAPRRRFSERWLTSRCLASELVKRFTALGRIRQRSSLRHDDLWTCYLMYVIYYRVLILSRVTPKGCPKMMAKMNANSQIGLA